MATDHIEPCPSGLWMRITPRPNNAKHDRNAYYAPDHQALYAPTDLRSMHIHQLLFEAPDAREQELRQYDNSHDDSMACEQQIVERNKWRLSMIPKSILAPDLVGISESIAVGEVCDEAEDVDCREIDVYSGRRFAPPVQYWLRIKRRRPTAHIDVAKEQRNGFEAVHFDC